MTELRGGPSAFGINQAGQILGFAFLGPGNFHSYIWRAREWIDSGASFIAYHINSNLTPSTGLAEAVGRADPGNATLYTDGALFNLNDLIPPGSGWRLNDARSINDSGRIVGNGSLGFQSHAFLLIPNQDNIRETSPHSDAKSRAFAENSPARQTD